MEKVEILFFPSDGQGNLFPAVEFSRKLLARSPNICITFFANDGLVEFFKLLGLGTRIKFQLVESNDGKNWQETVDSYKPLVKEMLIEMLSKSNSKVALIIDFYSLSMVELSKTLGIKSYLFLPMNLGFLSTMVFVGRLESKPEVPELAIPGFKNLVPQGVFPHDMMKKNDKYLLFQNLARNITETQGIIANTFTELEINAINALSVDENIPTVHPIGPLIQFRLLKKWDDFVFSKFIETLTWLNDQPDSSVLYICCGSLRSFSIQQSTEIAKAIKLSNCSFLWCDCDELKNMPENFIMQSVKEGKGLIMPWSNQPQVLAHKAIVGFLSHCGWNSIMESIWVGVPVLTLPQFSEQKLNSFMMVKEFGLGIELNSTQGSEVVMADEIHKGITELMTMKRDNELHQKMQNMKQKATEAMSTDGPSFTSIEKIIEDMFKM